MYSERGDSFVRGGKKLGETVERNKKERERERERARYFFRERFLCLALEQLRFCRDDNNRGAIPSRDARMEKSLSGESCNK